MSLGYQSPNSLAKAAAAWTAAQRLQQFCYANISFEVSTSLPHATHIVKGWETAGKVRRIATAAGKRNKVHFEVVPQDEIRVLPVIGDAYEQMWTTMRKLRGFSPVDLKATCAAGVSLDEAAAYCRHLLTAGYLRVSQKAVPPSKPAIYRLAHETGVKAPRLRRVACIIDPNLGTIQPLSELTQ